MNYKDVICDGCGKPLSDESDIVVCPICGTPQHRECYNANNHCVNEHLHSDNFEWQAPVRENPEETPEREQAEQSKTTLAAPSIDNAELYFLRGVLYDPNDEIDGVTVKDASLFMQNGTRNYIKKFMKSRGKKHWISWNWAAFFFSPYWFFFRKLYRLGTIFLAITVAVNVALYSNDVKILEITEEMQQISQEMAELYQSNKSDDEAKIIELEQKGVSLIKSIMPNLIIKFILGFLVPNTVAALIANSFYKKRMLRIITLTRNSSADEASKRYTIIKNGGVSLTLTLLSVIIGQYLPSILLSIAERINF